MAITQVKDFNGKDFSFDVSKVCDINGDTGAENSSITDSKRSRVIATHDVTYVNQSGETIDSTKLLKDVASGKTNIVALDVDVEATHSGKNHNYCVYYEDSMEKDVESFLNPFSKPMLKNHNDYSEPLGRVKQSWHGPSQLTDERSAIHLKSRVTDKDAIPKFLDGRYSTVSIGGSMGTVTCNICGKTILKDGKFKFCGHWRGETYKDQVCYWGARDIDYNEVSVVNNPADDFAQVVKVTVITDEDKEQNSDSQQKENDSKKGVGGMDTQNQTTSNQTDSRDKLISMIDELLGTKDSVTEVVKPNETVPTATEPTTEDGENKDVKTVEDVQKELDTAQATITDLQQKLEASEAKLADAEKAKTEAVQDATTMKDQCIGLALANKKLIADKVVELETSKGKLEDAKIQERTDALVAMSMRELNSALDAIKSETSVAVDSTRQPATQVQNPTLANTDEKNAEVLDSNGQTVVKDGKDKKRTEDSNKKSSIEDYTQSIVNRISKRQ